MSAVHNGRGPHTVLDPVEDLVGAEPHAVDRDGNPTSLVDLQPNGVVTPAPPHA